LHAGVCDAGGTYQGGYLAADHAGIPVAKIRSLLLSGRIPQDIIVASPTTSPTDVLRFEQALLSFDPKEQLGRDTLGKFERISGFQRPRIEEYEALRAAYLKEAPNP
jgi:ABC-type phosphate/phosphonate transport system substrate-binding protein